MIKLVDMLKEIGDASLAVPYKKTKDQSNEFGRFLSWEFKIGEDTYIVNSEIDEEDGEMSVEFRLSTAGITTRTNKGHQYKILATIINILKDYTQKHPEIVKVSYFPAKSSDDDDQREKLYKIYFDKNFPNWKYTNDDGEIHIEKPKSSITSKIKNLFKI